MKLLSVEGTFHDGKVDLTEVPIGLDQAKVIVTFLDPKPAQTESRPIRCGELASPELIAAGRYSAEADFKIAEYHGDERWDDEDGK